MLERSDEQLVELVLEGHDEAFEVLFDRHVADGLWYAREVLGSWGEAEDAVRHSFAAAHAYLATRGRETEFRPWLQTILGNYCLSMLQARASSSEEESVDEGTVVDLGEWRLRRKLFGAALPIAPSLALRDSVMTACGIGTGVTAAGVPLLSGMLANVAVVAVLAGSVGIAGNVVSDRAGAVAPGTRAAVEQVANAGSGLRDIDLPHESSGQVRSPLDTAVRELVGTPRATHKEAVPRDRGRTKPSPSKSSPSTGSGPPGPALPKLDSVTDDAPVAIPPPVQATLRRVADVVRAHVPATGGVSDTRLPDSIDLSQIGDDLSVTAIESPVDVRALLSQEADPPLN